MTKEGRIYTRVKAVSSINGVGKIGQMHAKTDKETNKNWTTFLHLYRNRLKMNQLLKCKTPNHKTSRRKQAAHATQQLMQLSNNNKKQATQLNSG